MVGFPFEEGVLTSLEHERLNAAFSIIRGVVQDSVESSIELGLMLRGGAPLVFVESLLLREVSIVENIKNIWRKDNAKDNYMPRNTK